MYPDSHTCFYHGIIIAVTDKTTQQHVAVRIPFIQQHLILGDVIVLLVSIQNVLIDKIFDTDIVFKSQQWIYIPAVPAFAVIRMKSGPGITKYTKGGYQGRNSILYIGLIYVAPGGRKEMESPDKNSNSLLLVPAPNTGMDREPLMVFSVRL